MCEPESYAEATRDANWRAAMEEEMRTLDASDTWDLIDPPSHYKLISYKWVFKMKYNADGSVNRYKAPLLAKGYA